MFNAYVEMLPRLDAEESLNMISNVAVGSGNAEKDPRTSYLRSLQRAAQIETRAIRPTSFGQLEAIGIQVEDFKADG